MSGAVTEVESGVFCARGTEVNWVLVREGRDLTLIDSGYPGDADAVEASVHHIGLRPEDIRAIVVTHGHIDHIGSIDRLHHRYRIPVYASPIEAGHVRGEYSEQVGALGVAVNLRRRGVAAWALRVMRAGALQTVTLPDVREGPVGEPLDVPGRPVPVVTAGHTSGHTVYYFPSTGVLVTGDELVTGHAVSRLSGPQLLPRMFNHGTYAAAVRGLDTLAGLDVGVLVPGHGDPLRTTIGEALIAVRRSATDPRQW